MHHFPEIGAGSASELEYQLLLAKDLGYLDDEVHSHLRNEANGVRRMLYALMKRVQQNGR